ncbi:export membrane protein SecD [[Bacteroides] pectinophilus ATCC 43243]|uniref:Multifunctional fusion protein n=2 Tax=[Bacteroides] pectinophilus TaxID=384638 RepID=B7AQW8_9FIRM|nr:export membrane protein SecD [[Bacteroides] pectinophilus ATCC 43243]
MQTNNLLWAWRIDMRYNLKKKIIYSIIILALLFGMSYVAIFGMKDGYGSIGQIKQGLDLAGGVSITYEIQEDNPSDQDVSDTIYKLQQRVTNYSTEAEVYKEGGNRITVEIPDVTDANAILEELGQPGTLMFLDSDGYTKFSNGEECTPLLTGSDVKNAVAGADTSQSSTSKYVVSLEFNDEGKQKFADATSANVGKIIYIVYDGKVVSAPRVNEAITGGSAQIDGMSSYDEANTLASYVRIGAMPLELKEMRSQVVGAKLGETAIQTSLLAGAIGLAILCLFMIIAYRVPGVAACLALVIYVALDIFILSVYEITLTLSGIAGIVLSIGMAVDANVVIFSRIREEIGAGKSVDAAIEQGFKKAMSAVVDGNVTTIIAALVLYLRGSGSVKGFAVTLGIGVVLSMFTALVISKTIVRLLYNFGCKSEKLYGSVRHKKIFDFVSMRKATFAIPGVILAICIIVMIVFTANGKGALNYSLDFAGGTSTTVTFAEEMSLADIDANVIPVIREATGVANVQQQKVTDSTQVVFKTDELSLAQREALNTALENKFGVADSDIDSQSISSTVSSEMKQDAVIATVLAIICILIYVWFRFKDISFAGSTVLALVHDVAIVFTFYVFSRLSVGGTFIACMLTIVGYSVNSTIVIFDRVRDTINSAADKSKLDYKQVVNESITNTLTRSINTSLTTFIMLAVLYIFGVATIREFALPLMVGIIAGAFSSVFLTGNMWLIFRAAKEKHQAKSAAREAEKEKRAEAEAAKNLSNSKKKKKDKKNNED